MIGTECIESRKDNLYIRTSITNPSFTLGTIPAIYSDQRLENIIDDACKYEVNVPLVRIPEGSIPIKLVDPELVVGTFNYNNMPEAIRINFKGVQYPEVNLQWETQLNLEKFNIGSDYPNINNVITTEDSNNKSFYRKYANYYSLYNIEGFAKIINEAFKKANELIPVVDRPACPPCVVWQDKFSGFTLHLPVEYIYNSDIPPLTGIPIIEFNNRMMNVFKKSLLVDYGRFKGNDNSLKWNTINNNVKGRPSIKDYDVTNFVPPYNQAVYTFNRNKTCGYTFQAFGGWSRIEVVSNLPLVKPNYIQQQNPKTGNIENKQSSESFILAQFFFDYTSSFETTGELKNPYPHWQSIATSGALNSISYQVYLVDNYGNRTPYKLAFGEQFNLDLQLRKVID